MSARRGIFLGLLAGVWGSIAGATESSNQSYIDQLLREMPESPEGHSQSDGTSYLNEIQNKLKSENPDQPSGSFIEEVKSSDPISVERDDQSYIEKQKIILDPKSEGGAIQAYHEGRSELEFKRPGNIHNAAGLRYSVSVNRTVSGTAGTQLTKFADIYGGNYAPEIALFYEYQPFHSEWFGNIGIVGNLGFNYFYGLGQFAIKLPVPGGVGFFPANSLTKFQFFTIPITVGINYRFNLLRIFRPYAMIGPTLIGYLESRNDGGTSYRGHSQGFTTSVGVSILLDWMSKDSSWNLYTDYAVKHYYVTIDFTRLTPISGDVSFSAQGVSAGLTFEY